MSIGIVEGAPVSRCRLDQRFEPWTPAGSVGVNGPSGHQRAEVGDGLEHVFDPRRAGIARIALRQQTDPRVGRLDRRGGFGEARRIPLCPAGVAGGRVVGVLVAVAGLIAELDRLDRELAIASVGPEGPSGPERPGPGRQVLGFGRRWESARRRPPAEPPEFPRPRTRRSPARFPAGWLRCPTPFAPPWLQAGASPGCRRRCWSLS